MNPARSRLPDDLLAGALRWRADGPDAAFEVLEDVMTMVRGTSQRRAWSIHLMDATRPVIVFVALAALLVTILGTAVFVGAIPLARDPLDLVRQRPFVAPFRGWPPEGAIPSTPETGELVLNEVLIHPFRSASVYADGRLIWDVGGDDAGALDTGGWVEQWLTHAGVDLLRRRVAPLSAWPAGPASSLPASAWLDRAVRAYVPSRYAFCYRASDPHGQSIELSAAGALGHLPKDVPALLQGSWAPRAPDSGSLATVPTDLTCREVTTETARAIHGAIIRAGADVDPWSDDTSYTLHPPGIEPDIIGVYFWPLLPDGYLASGFG